MPRRNDTDSAPPSFELPHAPPGTQELMEIAPDIHARRGTPRWVRWALVAFGCGWLLLLLGLFLMDAKGRREASAAGAQLGPDGLLPAARPLDLGPRDAEHCVLLVHGFAGTPRDFERFPEALAATGVRVVAMLLPGHGRTPYELAETDNETLLAAVRSEVDRLRASHARVSAVGFSMGSALVSLTAAETEFDRIALVGPYFGIASPAWALLPVDVWAGWIDPPVQFLYIGEDAHRIEDKSRASEMPRYSVFPVPSVQRLAELGRRAADPAALARVTEPALFVFSERDGAADPVQARAAFEGLGSTTKRLFEVERSQHLLFYDYDHEAVFDELIQFLNPPGAPGE